MEHRYADVNGVRLHYVESGSGPLIMFLHGFPEFWYQWRNQLQSFSSSHHAVAPDLRGYNLSQKPTEVGDYELSKLVEDIRALADHLGEKKMVLVGHDWGGVIAWAFAMTYPQYLEKLVILNAPHPVLFERELQHSPQQQKASEYIKFFISEQAEALLTKDNCAWLAKAIFNELTPKEEVDAYLKAWSQPGALTGMLNYYRAMKSAGGSSQPRPKISVPTLVLWGDSDKFVLLGNLDGLDEQVSNLTIRKFPNTSHWIVQEQTNEVTRAIRDFVG